MADQLAATAEGVAAAAAAAAAVEDAYMVGVADLVEAGMADVADLVEAGMASATSVEAGVEPSEGKAQVLAEK